MSLELNKIAAAVILAGLIGMTVSKITDGIYHTDADTDHGGHGEAPKRGYTIAGAENFEEGASGVAAVEAAPENILGIPSRN